MLQSEFDAGNNKHRTFQLPGSRPHYNPDRPGQVEHIFLDLVLDIPLQSYHGSCTIRLMPVRSGIKNLTLDAVQLNIQSVQILGVSQEFDYDGDSVHIQLQTPTQVGKAIEIAIAYSNQNPQRGIYFISPSPHYPNKPVQVWTQGEDEDSRYWFPCFDYPGQLATSEIRVQVPKPFVAISNGELLYAKDAGSDTIYHWKQPQVHPTYLMTLAVGDFALIQDTWKDIPVTYYVEKGREEDALRSMGKTPRMIEFFSEKYGYPYPFPKYAQVCVDDFIFGGMENTSTTLLTDRCLLDARAALDNRITESLVAHELAHQWFGDLVVIKHWSHAWIKEGMASYSEVMWTEQEYGADEAAYYRLVETRSYLSEDSFRYRRPIVTHIYREAIELYDRHLYEKGSCVYHMIRAELGDELFWRAIHTFVQDNAHKTVETIDLLRAIEKATGRNLLFLFDQYVFRGGHPDYKVAYSWDADSKLAKVTVTQTQATDSNEDLFDLKLPIAFGYTQQESNPKSKIFTVRVCDREQSFYFPLEEKPQFISFDAGNHYLKTVCLEYPLPELKAQLQFDPDPLSRIYAAAALAKKGGLEAVNALADALQNDPFWGVRVEVAKQLAEVKLDFAGSALILGLKDDSPYVRRAVAEALSNIKTLESYNALKQLVEKGDPSYYVEAAATRSLGSLVTSATLQDKSDAVIDLLTDVLKERAGWNDVVRIGALAALSQIKTSPVALNLILQHTAPAIPQALRLAAIRALGTISPGQTPNNLELILQQLQDLSKETFFLTQVAVVVALGQMETPKAMRILRSLSDQTPDGRVRRIADEAVQTVQKNSGSDVAVKQLREELDQIKKENQELKSRLENLEAKSKQ